MIVLGVVLLLLEWILGDAGVALPPVLFVLMHDVGIVLVVIGIILLVLSLVGRPIGGGWGPQVGGRRYWW